MISTLREPSLGRERRKTNSQKCYCVNVTSWGACFIYYGILTNLGFRTNVLTWSRVLISLSFDPWHWYTKCSCFCLVGSISGPREKRSVFISDWAWTVASRSSIGKKRLKGSVGVPGFLSWAAQGLSKQRSHWLVRAQLFRQGSCRSSFLLRIHPDIYKKACRTGWNGSWSVFQETALSSFEDKTEEYLLVWHQEHTISRHL